MQPPTESLCRAVGHYLARPRRIAAHLQPYVSHLQEAVQAAVPRVAPPLAPRHDHGDLLRTVLESCRDGDAAPIAQALDALAEPLPWVYSYPPRDGDGDLSTRIAFAEMIGPDGPLQAPRCRVGFTLVGRETEYPLHAHPAIELYLVLSGHAHWRTLDPWRMVPPGEFVLHRSNEAHAMRTADQPLLALWAWSGDLETPAYYL